MELLFRSEELGPKQAADCNFLLQAITVTFVALNKLKSIKCVSDRHNTASLQFYRYFLILSIRCLTYLLLGGPVYLTFKQFSVAFSLVLHSVLSVKLGLQLVCHPAANLSLTTFVDCLSNARHFIRQLQSPNNIKSLFFFLPKSMNFHSNQFI